MIETAALIYVGVPPTVASAAVTAMNGGNISDVATAAVTAYAGGQIASAVGGSAGSTIAATTESTAGAYIPSATTSTLVKVASSAVGADVAATTIALSQGKDLTTALDVGTKAAVSSVISSAASEVGSTVASKVDNATAAQILANAASGGTTAALTGKDIAGGAATAGTLSAAEQGIKSALDTGADALKSITKPTPPPAPTPAPVEQVAATPSGVPSAEDFAKLIGAAQPPTASLDTGVVSDAGIGVQVAGTPYLAENAPENIKNLVPAGYRLLSAEESLPQNVKATLLPNGEYAFIGQDTSPEYLATQELPTETIPETQQVAGIDLTAPEVVTATPETAAVGIGGPALDVAPEVAVAAPGAAESATVVRVDPSTGNALVMKPSGEVFTVAIDPSTKAGSTISVPSPATAPSTAPTSSPAPAPTTVPTTAPDFATAPTTAPAPEVATAPAPTPATDQPILDLIAERPTATDVAAPGEVPATPGKTPIAEPPVAAPATTTEPAPELAPAPAPVEVDASIPRVEVSGVGNIPTEPEPAPIAPPPVSDRDREILNLINPEPVAPEPVTETPLAPEEPGAVAPELPAEDVSVEEAGAEPEQPVYDYDPKAKPKPDIVTTTYLSPKTRTAAPTSALGSALGTTGLTSYRGAGEIEGTGSGKPRRKVWNEESLKLKDALGV